MTLIILMIIAPDRQDMPDSYFNPVQISSFIMKVGGLHIMIIRQKRILN